MDAYDSHNLEASLKFGMVPDGYVPPILDCVVHAGSAVSVELPRPIPPSPVPDDRWAGGLSDGTPIPYPEFRSDEDHYTGRVLDTRAVDPVTGKLVPYPAEVGMGDLSHLPDALPGNLARRFSSVRARSWITIPGWSFGLVAGGSVRNSTGTGVTTVCGMRSTTSNAVGVFLRGAPVVREA